MWTIPGGIWFYFIATRIFFSGILLWRGFRIDQCVNQCFGNKLDIQKSKQMPVHYGSKEHHFVTISSPIATQLPQGRENWIRTRTILTPLRLRLYSCGLFHSSCWCCIRIQVSQKWSVRYRILRRRCFQWRRHSRSSKFRLHPRMSRHIFLVRFCDLFFGVLDRNISSSYFDITAGITNTQYQPLSKNSAEMALLAEQSGMVCQRSKLMEMMYSRSCTRSKKLENMW